MSDPVGPVDFLNLLNSVSSVQHEQPSAMHLAPSELVVDADNSFRFGTTLRDLARNGSHGVFMLETAGFIAHVVPASHSVYTSQPLDDRTIRALTQPGIAVGVMQYPASYATQLEHHGAQRSSTQSVLWRIGLHGPTDRMLSELPINGAFKLRRWPDFDGLEHSADHLRTATQLSDEEIGVAALAFALGQPTQSVVPFINACALSDLLTIASSKDRALPFTASQAPTRTTQHSGIFQSIRSAVRE